MAEPFPFFNGSNAPAIKPPEWLIEGLAARGAGTILFGQPGVSKSVHAAWLCVSLTTGKSFAGLRVRGSGHRIMYLDLDDEWDRTGPVIEAAFKRAGYPRMPDSMYYYSVIGDKTPGNRGYLVLEDTAERLLASVQAFRPDIVIIDSLGQFMAGDTNDARAVSIALRGGLNPIRQYGAAVLVIDHATKAARLGGLGVPTPMGSQQKRAWARVTVALEEEDQPDEHTLITRWTVDKSNSRKFPPFLTRLRFETDDKDNIKDLQFALVGKAGPRKSEESTALELAKQSIIERLQAGPASRADIGYAGSSQRALDELLAAGRSASKAAASTP